MTPTSAGSQSKEKGFLDNYIEDLKKERIPEEGDRALRGEGGDDVSGKMDRGVLKAHLLLILKFLNFLLGLLKQYVLCVHLQRL